MEYILHMHNHAGWYTQRIEANSIAEAIKEGLNKRAGFLAKDYAGKYRIEHDNPDDEYPRYRVIWDSDELKGFPFGQTPLRKGDRWWSDRFQIGEKDDCESCGGTGINHYYTWRQCWSCGNKDLEGKGTGKTKEQKQ